MPDLSPTEQRLLELLNDGLPHDRTELYKALYDDLGDMTVLRVHISNLNAKLRRVGREVVCRSYGKYTRYQQFRSFSHDE